jgi:hypothetical protein
MLLTSHIGVLLSSTGEAWSPKAVTFDGANDYLTKTTALAGAATKQLTVYARVKVKAAAYGNSSIIVNIGDGATGSQQILRLRFEGGSGNSKISIQFRDYPAFTLSGAKMAHASSETFVEGDGFTNVLFSFDSQSGAQTSHFYFGDTAASGYSDTPALDYEFAWNQALTARVGSRHSAVNDLLNADVGSVWMAPVYYDLSNAANRRLFFDASGNPVNPPSGAVLYFGGAQMASAWNAGTNQGSGGDLVMTGAVADV